MQIEGVKRLSDAEHTVIPDRIVAATYLSCGAAAGGTLELTNVVPSHMEAVLSVAEQYGAKLYISEDRDCCRLRQSGSAPVKMVLHTAAPGLSARMAQSPLMAALTLARGTSIFVENIFESRYKHVYELCRMGADITVDGRLAVVRGVGQLSGANVCAMDLRGGADLLWPALRRKGARRLRMCII